MFKKGKVYLKKNVFFIDFFPTKNRLSKPEPMALRHREKIQPPARYRTEANTADTRVEPQTLAQSDAEKWMRAMEDEIKSMKDHGVWTPTELPAGKRAITCRWIYKIKTTAENEIDRFRARLCARGFAQIPGEDFQELFAPVARMDTIRTLLAISAARKLHLRQSDVKVAFLYGDLPAEIFMNQPPGFQDGTNRVCRLSKSLYGLRQAPRCFNRKLASVLRSLGFTQSNADNCLYYRHGKNGEWTLLAVYVDDGIISSTHEHLITDTIDSLKHTSHSQPVLLPISWECTFTLIDNITFG